MSEIDILRNRIEQVLDTVRDSIRLHDGDIQFNDYREGIVYISLRGACVGCPISEITVKMGIEEALKAEIPEVISVVAQK
jgi:Fe-S cluster biogenesis protein NfuA